MEIVFFIKGDIRVYINNGSLTIYIFIDIRITYCSMLLKYNISISRTADKKDNNPVRTFDAGGSKLRPPNSYKNMISLPLGRVTKRTKMPFLTQPAGTAMG
jgi:hypothetical protein